MRSNLILRDDAVPAQPRVGQTRKGGATAEPGDIDVRSFLRAILRHKLMFLGVVVVGIALCLWWINTATRRYTADAVIMIESRPSSIVVVDEGRQELATELVAVNTQIAVLKSRSLAAKVIDELELEDDPEFASGDSGEAKPLPQRVTAKLEELISRFDSPKTAARSQDAAQLAGASQTGAGQGDGSSGAAGDGGEIDRRKRPVVINNFLGRLVASSEGQSRLITISFESGDPVKAAKIVNKLLEVYIQSQLAAKTEGVRLAAKWLETRLAELGETVRQLETKVLEQRAQVGLVQDGGGDVATLRLNQLNAEVVRIEALRTATEARYRRVRQILESGADTAALPEVIASPTVQTERGKLAALEARLSDLSTQFGDGHRKIIALRSEIAETRQHLFQEVRIVLTSIGNELGRIVEQEKALKTQLDEAAKDVAHLNTASLAISQLSTQLQANRSLYETLLKRYTETVALRDNQQPDARVISDAQVPLSPSFPKEARTLALASIGSVGFGLFLVFMAERFRNRLTTAEDAERHLGTYVLAIPEVPRLRRMMSLAAQAEDMEVPPLSEAGSVFQRLRAIMALDNGRRMPQVILVTSPAAGEGKTTVAVCMTVASVSSGQRTLLIDCDFRQPQIHRIAGIRNDLGLSELLAGMAALEEVVVPLSPTLSVLPNGTMQRGSLDMLNSERMRQLLGALGKQYDQIILDSGSVLQWSEPLLLGGLAERTILVTRRNWTRQEDAALAASQLMLYGAELGPVVFNRATAKMTQGQRIGRRAHA
ncbi:GumC family protein [Azospirillum thermophilum]|uniref:Uncharacterized protein n=1 Tax=Azospirillum thermophilum TaxID=2202148 RepID=A0A2S2CVS8_9PROT|nr:polysaccharide biosynthesis tyrosine autokinase [Azospirillum thermophilum]AWK88490.1 hypothetical protein DEW08_20725 [Azospirillum thermophilum]